MIMNFNDIQTLYEKYKEQYGKDTYKKISEILIEAKEKHKEDFLKKRPNGDHEQSWRAFKGKNLEKLIIYIISDEVKALGLEVINGNSLEMIGKGNLSPELEQVKRNLVVDFGEFGKHPPDVDLVVFEPKNSKVIAILSCKVTLRERVAQTGYWKKKLMESKLTDKIKVFFLTLDEDGTLTIREPAKKGRAIVETDLDGTYVMTEAKIVESDKVKLLDKFIDDLKKLKG
jgi:type II restriction enzyme